MATSENDEREIALNYAWNWFEYHARQRLTGFNYFLILVGVIVVGYMKCVELAGTVQSGAGQACMARIWWLLASSLSLFGLMISVAFWFLDIRNEELVNCGRNALELLEPRVGLSIRQDDKTRKYLENSLDILSRQMPVSYLRFLASHRFLLRSIILLAALAFFIAFFYAIWSSLTLTISGSPALERSYDFTIAYVTCRNLTTILM